MLTPSAFHIHLVCPIPLEIGGDMVSPITLMTSSLISYSITYLSSCCLPDTFLFINFTSINGIETTSPHHWKFVATSLNQQKVSVVDSRPQNAMSTPFLPARHYEFNLYAVLVLSVWAFHGRHSKRSEWPFLI